MEQFLSKSADAVNADVTIAWDFASLLAVSEGMSESDFVAKIISATLTSSSFYHRASLFEAF